MSCNSKCKKAVVTLLKSVKIDFMTKKRFITIKESVHQEDIILNMYASNTKVSKNISSETNKTKRRSRQIHSDNQKLEFLSAVDRTSRKKPA